MAAMERPVYYEGQVLAARDLTAAVDHHRGQLSRHARYLHSWGIGDGLDLTKVEKSDPVTGDKYVEVTLQPGYAVDGAGREVVVPSPVRLSEALFRQINPGADPTSFFPVLLQGRDSPAPRPAFAQEACGGDGQVTRLTEGYDLTFGRAGDERGLAQQPVPDPTAGPEATDPPWRLLLGFVTWNPGIDGGRFASLEPEANGIGRRYAGVVADSVTARSGRLVLQTQRKTETGKPAVVFDEKKGELGLGVFDGTGNVTDPVFSVNLKGDLMAKGTLSAQIKTGTVQVQSGVATDGLLVPLPPGVTQEQVDGGKVTLHISVSPHIPGSAPPGLGDFGQFPRECEVDGDRRIHCRVRWLDLGTSTFQDLPAACDYLVIASVPAT